MTLRLLPAMVLVAGTAVAQSAIETTVQLHSPEAGTATTVFADPGAEVRRLVPGDWRVERLPAEMAAEIPVAPGPDGVFRVPVPIPIASGALDFAARILPPPGYRAVDVFPSRMELPAPPSLLRFRLVPEDARGISLAAAVDLAALALLAGLAGFGALRVIRTS